MLKSSWSRLTAAVFKASSGPNSRSRRGRRAHTEQLESRILLSAGALDETFDGDGIVSRSIGAAGPGVGDAEVQADGKILVIGLASNGGNHDFAITRFNTTGSVDTGFGAGGTGTAFVSFGNSDDFGQTLTVLPDGRILVAGSAGNDNNDDVALARLSADGLLDITFSVGGRVVIAVGTSHDEANSITTQQDGKILIGGYSIQGDHDMLLMRFNAIGSRDDSFGVDGVKTIDFGSTDNCGEVVVQADGKQVIPIGTGDDESYDLVMQPDGKFVQVGRSNVNGVSDIALVRYTSTGQLETSFGAGEKVTTAIGSGIDVGYGVALQSDAKSWLQEPFMTEQNLGWPWCDMKALVRRRTSH